MVDCALYFPFWRLSQSALCFIMKTSLTSKMLSGTSALLFTFTLTFTPTARAVTMNGSQMVAPPDASSAPAPDGYASNGQPYYYAYPDEGYADESPIEAPPPDYDNSYTNPDQSYGYDDSDVVPYYDSWGWGYPAFGFGFNGNIHHHQFRQDIGRRNFNHNFTGHSTLAPHRNSMPAGNMAVGSRMAAPSGHMGFGGGHSGGGHR
jgi:hypothetical protein